MQKHACKPQRNIFIWLTQTFQDSPTYIAWNLIYKSWLVWFLIQVRIMKNYSCMVFLTSYSERLNKIFQCQNWDTNLNIQVPFLPFDKGFHFFLAEHCSADILPRSSELLAQVTKVKDKKLKIFTGLFPLHIHQTFKYFLRTLNFLGNNFAFPDAVLALWNITHIPRSNIKNLTLWVLLCQGNMWSHLNAIIYNKNIFPSKPHSYFWSLAKITFSWVSSIQF